MKTLRLLYMAVFITTILMINNDVCAQISKGGTPPSFSMSELKDSIFVLEMSPVNVDSLIEIDSLESTYEKPFRFGYAIDVNMNLNNSGTWDTLPNGDRICRLKITSLGAFSINLIFDDFWLPDGAEFFVYSEDKNMILGAFTAAINNNQYNKFSTDLVKGDVTVLEYYEPAYADGGRINVGKVIHGYKNVFPESGHDQTAYTCHNDVNCSVGADWCVEKRAVSMILVDNNTTWCSGCLINNVRVDLTPYYLTANHCLRGDETTWIFRFKYWSPTCNQGDDATHWVSISGSNVRANNASSDFALLELSTKPPSGFGVLYAGWDRTTAAPSSSAVIHHPAGATMKISFDNDPATSSTWTGTPSGSHWQVILDNGTTEGGSSGAPLFNQDHKIVGQNHGGNAGCPPITKWYGKFSVSWNNGLSGFLDPDNTGATSIGPTSPTIYLINRTLTGTHKFAALEEIHIEGNVAISGSLVLCQPSNVPFTTEPGSNVEIKAKRIVCKPGTHFKAGSTVHIKAVDNIECSDNIVKGDYVNIFCYAGISMKMGGQSYTSNDSISNSQQEKEKIIVNISEKITLYPNPNTGKFEIAISDGNIDFSEVLIYNVAGKIVFEKNYISENIIPIDLCNLQKGIYIIQLIRSGNSYTKKIILN